MTNKTIAIYARYSSDLQKESSIEDQIASCQKVIASNKLNGEAVVFMDKAMSGKNLLDRPDIINLLKDVKEEKVAFVVAEGLDRLSRDLEGIAAIYKICQFYGVQIYTSLEGKVSKMHIGFTGTISSIYIDNLIERIKRGQEGVVRNGKIPGGLSYGYAVRYLNDANLPEAGLRIIDKEQAKIVRWIYDAFIGGMSCTKIRDELNQRCVPAPRGKFWNLSTITGHGKRYGTGILRNPIYTGEVIWNRVTYVINPITMARQARVNDKSEWIRRHDPNLQIITKEQWDAVQEEWKRRSPLSPKKVLKHRKFAIKVFCKKCGSRMNRFDANYLICSRYKRSKQCDFNNKININKLESVIYDTMLNGFDRLWGQWQKHHAEENEMRKAERTKYFKQHKKKPELDYLPPIDDLHKGEILKSLSEKISLERLVDTMTINMKEVGDYRLSNIKPNWKNLLKIIYPNHT